MFEGGGVKGIGLIGAAQKIEQAGYHFVNMAGTSAGAIVASLLAVGYTAEEISAFLLQEDFSYLKFKDEGFIDKMGLMGKTLGVILEYGIYEGNYFREWIENLFAAKGKTTFGDIRQSPEPGDPPTYKFRAIASDLTDKRMLILPEDIREFGYDPDQFSLSLAVRMSMSIPIFFEPVTLTDSRGRIHYIVDGGVLSNYPVWLLDSPYEPRWPTFGFKLNTDPGETDQQITHNSIRTIVDYFESMVATMLDAHDKYYISTSKGDFERTIMIPVTVRVGGQSKKISTTDFAITPDESEALLANGYHAAEAFLRDWDFEAWKRKYRSH